MAQSAQVSFRIDEDIKRSAERALDDMGLTRIPFEVSADPFYSESNIRYLEGILQDIKEGRAHFAEHDLIEVDE